MTSVPLLDGFLIGRNVGLSVMIFFKGGKLHFQAPIGAHVYLWLTFFIALPQAIMALKVSSEVSGILISAKKTWNTSKYSEGR